MRRRKSLTQVSSRNSAEVTQKACVREKHRDTETGNQGRGPCGYLIGPEAGAMLVFRAHGIPFVS